MLFRSGDIQEILVAGAKSGKNVQEEKHVVSISLEIVVKEEELVNTQNKHTYICFVNYGHICISKSMYVCRTF